LKGDIVQYTDYIQEYGKLEAHKLSNAEVLAQYRIDTAACIAAVETSPAKLQHKHYYNEDKQLVRATACLETGEILEHKVFKAEPKPIIKSNGKTIATGALFWEVAAAKLNAEYANKVKEKASAASSPPKRGVKPKIVPNKVKGDIECFGSVTEWVESQPAVDNILFGATHLSTKTEWNEFDKPINTGLVFSVLKECDTINTTDTMELTGLSKSQAERINAVVRVVNTQYSNCRVI
jgi:hypothetical protein